MIPYYSSQQDYIFLTLFFLMLFSSLCILVLFKLYPVGCAHRQVLKVIEVL